MTGNTSKWRAPLAGLASIAMLATMGMAAGTANALQPAADGTFGTVTSSTKAEVKIYNADNASGEFASFTLAYGDVVTDADVNYAADASAVLKGKVLDFLSLDRAGAHKVSDPYVVTGDVKLFAHFKAGITVGFDTNNDGTADESVVIAKGAGLTAHDYDLADRVLDGNTPETSIQDVVSGAKFAGWSTEYTKDKSSNNLYEGGALNEDTTLYPVYVKIANAITGNSGKDAADVAFLSDVNTTIPSADHYRYTLNNHAFPAFRAPSASGTWKKSVEAAAYDFSTTVTNKDSITPNGSAYDLKLYDVTASGAQDSTVNFDYRTAYSTLYTGIHNLTGNTDKGQVKTTSDQKIAKPADPVRAGYVFTGWYTTPAYNQPQAKKYDFTKSVGENFSNPSNVTLYAGWDDTNVAQLVFNLLYKDWTTAQQVLFVNPGKSTTLPFGLEDYWQTKGQENTTKPGTDPTDPAAYTTRKLAGWYLGSDKVNTVTKFTANKAKSVSTFNANWSADAISLKLVANGGYFDGDKTKLTKSVTKDSDQSWTSVVTTPVKDGYTFVQWRNDNPVGTKDEGELIANLSDGYWYTTKSDASRQQTLKDQQWAPIADGAALKAEWAQGARVDIDGYRNQFGLRFGNANEIQDVLTVAAYGYTDASAKAYVKAVNALEDEYAAYKALPEGQAKIDAANALAAKYEAAQALLVKSNGAEVPDGKVAVYRAFNPNETRGGSHLYTTSFTEYSSVVRAGWRAEGVQFQTTSSKTAAPVYRLYNKNDGSHHYTLSVVEKNSLVKASWTYENVSWYVASDAPESVYRIYNANSGEHVFTLSKVEANAAVRAGWNDEGVAFKAYAK